MRFQNQNNSVRWLFSCFASCTGKLGKYYSAFNVLVSFSVELVFLRGLNPSEFTFADLYIFFQLYVLVSLHIKLLFKVHFGFCHFAQRVCDYAWVTSCGVSVCMHAEKDLAAGSAQGMLLTQGEGDRAPSSHTTICTASNVPSKCWWVSTWGWPLGGIKPDLGQMNHEVLAVEVGPVRLATPHNDGDLQAPAL